jgi:ATP-binding cassette subfamily B protein
VEREAERSAFAKACGYLNYNSTAKWLAHAAAACTGLVYVALLAVLWLFADLMVYRGHLPSFHDLPLSVQGDYRKAWKELSESDRETFLKRTLPKDEEGEAPGRGNGDLDKEAIEKLAKEDPSSDSAPPALLNAYWRAEMASLLEQHVGQKAADQAQLYRADYNLTDHGVLGLVVRAEARNSWLARPLAWLARWNTWMWRPRAENSVFSVYLTGLLITGIVLALLYAGLTLLMRDMAARAVVEATTRLRRAVYHHTFRLGTLAFRALGPTEAVTVFTRHVEAVHEALFTYLTVYFREPIRFGLILLFALCVNVPLALAFLSFALIVWLLGGQLASYFRHRGRQATNQAGERLTIMRESIMLMRLVKCYLMEQFNQARVERQLARYGKVQLVRHRGEAIYQPLLMLFGFLCALILLYFAGVNVLTAQLGVAGVVALATALVSLYRPLERWLESRRFLRRGRESAAQLFKFLERRGEVGQVVGAEFVPPLSKQIEFDNVSLREPGGHRMLLEEVTLTIKSGQKVGLIGADDLEKHALVYLIPRLLDPTTGEIRIDQHNLRWVTLDSLRVQIAVVLQHNLVFHDTVANNIGCGDSAYTLPQIIEAAKVAHAHSFIQKLPQGYETPIGELGHSLTVSEQFRIALARAVLRDPALLVIEEPEAALDEDTKSLLDDTLARVLPNRTAIFLPHRISTIRSCDQVFLLHKGRIVATGVHKELLSSNPLYRHLHYLEFNEIEESV